MEMNYDAGIFWLLVFWILLDRCQIYFRSEQ